MTDDGLERQHVDAVRAIYDCEERLRLLALDTETTQEELKRAQSALQLVLKKLNDRARLRAGIPNEADDEAKPRGEFVPVRR